MTHDLVTFVAAGGAAIAAGAVNAIAGGGSLITFPALVALGLPPVSANVTNTVALCPGYFGATLAQRRDLVGQGRRIGLLAPAGLLGGIAGAELLLHTDPRAFDVVVPFLLLLASLLVAGQARIARLLFGHARRSRVELLAALPVAVVAVYGGYFGAGMGVLFLAALAIVLGDSLLRVNALKHVVALAVNAGAAGVFVASGRVDWSAAAVMLACALVGGLVGGRLVGRIPAAVLRSVIVVFGVVLSVAYFIRLG
jgi:uncharacterized membrane protein YfcA